MKDGKALGVIGFVATVIGFLASMLSKWVDGRKQEETIKTEVAKAVENHFKK